MDAVAVDTNVLVYAEGVNGGEKQNAARTLFRRLRQGPVVIPVQALGELFNVLTRRARWPVADAARAVSRWGAVCHVVETSHGILQAAITLSAANQLQIWDAIIVSAAAHAGCATLLSDDMQHGFTWRGTTVHNPFLAPSPH